MNAPAPVRAIVFRIRFETLALTVGAAALAFGIAHAAHERAPGSTNVVARAQPAWTGRIADVSASDPSATDATMTSASLVVPPSTLALPAAPRVAAKSRPCEEPACPGRAVPVPAPIRQHAPMVVASADEAHGSGTGLIGKLNPLNHIPDAVRHPFEIASSTITGWFKRP